MIRTGLKSYIGGVFILIFATFLFAQETHNLEIIWVKTGDTTFLSYGLLPTTSGDVNGDGFCDILYYGNERSWAGRAFLFYGGNNLDTIPAAVFSNSNGYNAVCMGDFNGDNFDDVALGNQNGPDGYGRAYIYLGGNPIDTICDFQMRGPQGGSLFGQAISAGDVNGDSFADLIVGAYGAAPRPGAFDMGQVYIYFGGSNFDTIPDGILNGGHQGDYEGFGTSVGGKGDVNSDGYQDIIIGAANFGPSYNGRIYIYFGGNPPDSVADVSMIGEGPNQQLGWSKVDFLKNLNDFDYATASTSLWPRGGGYCPGKIYVLFGGNNMDSIPDVWMIGRQDSSALGTSTSSAGDLTQDFFDEIISGAPIEYDFKGSSYLWLGDSTLDSIPDAWIRGTQHNDGIGWCVATAGDVNDDAKDEIIVSNYAAIQTPKKVWVCKYTGPGIEEHGTLNAIRLTLEISPNPAKSAIRIRCPLALKDIKVYDISGKIVKVLEINKAPAPEQNGVKWDLRDDNQKRISNGIYFLEITVEKELKEIRKITVIK